MRPFRHLSAWIADPDPLVAAANLIAVTVGANGPFYPLYIWFLIGSAAAPTVLTMLASPFFLAIPLLSRRSGRAARAAVPLLGTLNTAWCAKLIGVPSGVELFLVPCVTIAALLFRRNERWLMLPLTGLPIAVFLLLHDRYGLPLLHFTPAEYSAMLSLNAVSIGTLTGFLGLVFSAILASGPADKPPAQHPQ